MAAVSTYLNFKDETEQAFTFYKKVFRTDFNGPINRFGDMPPMEGMPPTPEEGKNLVMHVEITILGSHRLMGTDAPEFMGFKVNKGNNVHISLHPDSREEADRLFNELSEGGVVTMPMQDVFWGDYYGSCTDKFGVQWMLNFTKAEN